MGGTGGNVGKGGVGMRTKIATGAKGKAGKRHEQEAISQAEIEEARHQTRIGTPISMISTKLCDPDGCTDRRYGIRMEGVIVGIYHNFAFVRLDNGIHESVPWVDIAKARRRRR